MKNIPPCFPELISTPKVCAAEVGVSNHKDLQGPVSGPYLFIFISVKYLAQLTNTTLFDDDTYLHVCVYNAM